MDDRKFDKVTKSLSAAADRRGVIKGAAGAALAGLVALVGARSAGAAVTCPADRPGARCNTDEKCEAKCGRESALCCNGTCILGGCGPDRALNLRTCQCCRVDERGQPTNTGCRAPKCCGG